MPSIYALKRKHKKLQEEYDLKSEELDRLRKAHTIETDPSQKFKFEKQIEQLDQKRKQLEQELEKSEHQIEVILSGVEGPPFQWDYSKFPIDFSSKIEFLTQYFVGRQEAIEKIEQFIQTHKSGYLAIVGEAGIGKSALLAHEVKKRGTVHHFVDDKQNSAKDEVFLRCIVEQLRQKYDFEFGERMPISVSEWNIYFQKWMKEISTEEKLVICVDALDEAQHYGGSDSLLKYLPYELPDNVYFILTSRPEFKKEDITLSDSVVFETYNLPKLKEIDIKAYLTQHSISKQTDEIAKILYQKSEGNPLYLYYLVQECDSENLMLEQANQLPQELAKFYEKQWKERIWTGEKASKEGRKQILCLLLLLKEPPNEDMLLTLTDFDRAELQEYLNPLRRFMRTGKHYELFHDSFKNFVQSQFAKALSQYQTNLVDWLWNWQVLQKPLRRYALAWLPNHLADAHLYEKLFALIRDDALRKAQIQAFPNDLHTPLRTLQIALQGAADNDNAVCMAEFLLVHAQQVIEITQENPLEALRKGNLARAYQLADLFIPEKRVRWYLLLAWELQDTGRLQEARTALQRLQQQPLPRIKFDKNEACLFAGLYEYHPEEILALSRDAIENSPTLSYHPIEAFYDIYELICRWLIHWYKFDLAQKFAGQMMTGKDRAKTLIEIVTAQAKIRKFANVETRAFEGLSAWRVANIAATQAKAGEFAAAQTTVQTITDGEERAWALGAITVAQAKAGEFATAQTTAQTITDKEVRVEVLRTIAALQVQAGVHDNARFVFAIAVAQADAQTISDKFFYVEALRVIAVAQARVMAYSEARVTFEIAQRIADEWEHAWREKNDIWGTRTTADRKRAWALREIAVAQAKNGEFAAAQVTARTIIDEQERAEALREITAILAQAGEFMLAQVTAQIIADKRECVGALTTIAVAQAQVSTHEDACATFASAQVIAQTITNERRRTEALWTIAEAQARVGEFVAAQSTAQMIPDKRKQVETLSAIASAQTQARMYDDASSTLSAAQATVQTIAAEWEREWALISIAAAQAQSGDFVAAQTTAQAITSACQRAEALREIASAQARIGANDEAHTTFVTSRSIAQRIGDQEAEARVLGTIAIAQAQAGNFAAAKETAHMIYPRFGRYSLLSSIAVLQVRAGEGDSAQETTQMILYHPERIKALRSIAFEQAKYGYSEEALRTSALILLNRDEYLPQIASVFAENGDQEHFKSLLFPCAYYLNAAYKMCGHLARMCPEQATAIAKVLLKKENHLL